MPSPSGALWLQQARSDLEVARRIAGIGEPSFRCHVLAKCQQATEKAIKGEAEALFQAGILGQGPTRQHTLERELGALKRLPTRRSGARQSGIIGDISAFLRQEMRADICRVCDLAPGPRDVNGLEQLNTEYPFQKPDGQWTIPADAASFSEENSVAFLRVAGRTCDWAEDIIEGLARVRRRR